MAMKPRKKKPVKKMRSGGMVKKMRGGGMVKKMRGGGMVKKKGQSKGFTLTSTQSREGAASRVSPGPRVPRQAKLLSKRLRRQRNALVGLSYGGIR